MDKSIERIIRRALENARAKGRYHLTQTEEAVRAGRPDLPAGPDDLHADVGADRAISAA